MSHLEYLCNIGVTDDGKVKHYRIIDVDGDGNCLYTAVELELQDLGIQHGTLRQQLADYLQQNPLTPDGYHLRESISDKEDDQDSRWQKFLEGVRTTKWGDHIEVQGLANMLKIDIHIIATGNPNTEPIKSLKNPSARKIHLGLIGQFHYVRLKAIEDGDPPLPNTTNTGDLEGNLHLHHTIMVK